MMAVTAVTYTQPTYVIWLRESDTLDAVQQLGWFEYLEWTRSAYDLGKFEFVAHNDHVDTDWLQNDGIIEIRRNDSQEFIGLLTSAILDDATGMWTARGFDARYWFSFRDIRPAAGNEFDSQSGVAAETALIHYVEDHLTAPTDSNRDVDSELGTNVNGQTVTFETQTDAGQGNSITYNGRWRNLLTAMFQIARAGDVFFDVELDDRGSGYDHYQLAVSVSTDRTEGETGAVVFSTELGTAERVELVIDRSNYRNAVVALGPNRGADRAWTEQTDSTDVTNHYRREGTVDGRNTGLSATLTLTANPADTETVTIGGKTYTYEATLTDSDGNVLIGADAEESANNLIAAINLDDGAGSLYAASMTENSDVTAVSVSGSDAVKVTLKQQHSAAVSVSETLANGSWDVSSITITELEEVADAKIDQAVARTESWTVIPDPIRAPYRDNWDLFDDVTVKSRFITASADKRIMSVTVRYSAETGERIRIDIGDPPVTLPHQLAGALSDLNQAKVE